MNARKLLRRTASMLLAMLILTLAAPALGKSREKILQETLRIYAATIRWGSIEQAESFVDPKYREAHPLTQLELDRYKHVRFTAYNDRAAIPVSDSEVRQTVEIGIVNINTQEARNVIDQQIWTYNPKAKVWLLSSGLPDITRRD